MTRQSNQIDKEKNMNIDTMKKHLDKGGFDIIKEIRLSNGSGTWIRLKNRAIVIIYDKGTYIIQGKNMQQVKIYLEGCTLTDSSSTPTSDKIFVYEHYRDAKNLLELLLPDIVRKYEWDESKRAANIAKHKIDFDAANGFDWLTAITDLSPRDGEMRFAATGYIGERRHRLVFTPRDECNRIISLRPASKREVLDYERRRTQSDGNDL